MGEDIDNDIDDNEIGADIRRLRPARSLAGTIFLKIALLSCAGDDPDDDTPVDGDATVSVAPPRAVLDSPSVDVISGVPNKPCAGRSSEKASGSRKNDSPSTPLEGCRMSSEAAAATETSSSLSSIIVSISSPVGISE